MGFVVTADATVKHDSVGATATSVVMLLDQAGAMRNVDGMVGKAGRRLLYGRNHKNRVCHESSVWGSTPVNQLCTTGRDQNRV